jgi:hypothetical protein
MISWPDIINVFTFTCVLLLISLVIFLASYYANLIVFKVKMAHGTRQILRGLWGGFPLGFTGLAAGFLTGSSRTPAVTALVPAILTFVGLSVVYLMGKGSLRAIVAGSIVLVFSTNLIVGTLLGSVSRERAEQLSGSAEVSKARAEREFAIRRYRSALGLPPETPKSAASTSEKP